MSQTPLTPAEIEALDVTYRSRLESLQAVDEAVARFVAVLDSVRALSRTLIIFTSDNGWFSGEHALPSGKNLSYQEAIRVPLVIRGPGVRRGLRPYIALNIDLAPTIADFAGISIPASVDGRSLRPVLTQPLPVSSWRQVFLTEHWDPQGLSVVAGLHSRRWTYLEWGSGAREYFDLSADPFEVTSLIAAEDRTFRGYKGKHELLEQPKACAGANCWP